MRGPCQPERHVRSVQYQVLPIADAWQQFDAEKIRKTDTHGRSAVGVRVDAGSFQDDFGLLQAIEQVRSFVCPRGDEMGEVGDIVGADMAVRYATPPVLR